MSTTLATTKPAEAGKTAARSSPGPNRKSPAAGHADSELLALGAEFEIAWSAERRSDQQGGTDEELEADYQRTSDIVDKIAALKATSLDGLRVKARTALWCQGDENNPFSLGSSGAVDDMTIPASIVNDLLAGILP